MRRLHPAPQHFARFPGRPRRRHRIPTDPVPAARIQLDYPMGIEADEKQGKVFVAISVTFDYVATFDIQADHTLLNSQLLIPLGDTDSPPDQTVGSPEGLVMDALGDPSATPGAGSRSCGSRADPPLVSRAARGYPALGRLHPSLIASPGRFC